MELPETPANLSQHNIFFPSDPRFHGEWLFWLHDHQESVLLTPHLMINNSDAMPDAILQGVGIDLIPTFIAARYLQNGQLKRVLPYWRIEDPIPATEWAITLSSCLLSLKARVFIDDFMAWLKATREPDGNTG